MGQDAESGTGFVVLSDEALAGLGIGTAEIVDAIEAAVRSQARGDVWTAPKAVALPGDGRYLMTTLSSSDSPQVTAVKSVMVSPRNPARGMNAIEGAVLLQDSETGHVLALMQAGWITAVRTAGLSGVAARRLASPEASSIAFVGAGQQARSHLRTFSDLFPIREIRIVGRGQANIDSLTAMAEGQGQTARTCTTAREALEGADLVVTSVPLSTGIAPFLDAGWLKPGAFAAITDASVPWHQDSFGAFGTIVIDDRAQEEASAQKMVPEALITTDLSGLVADAALHHDPGRPGAFIFRGLAIGDFAVAALAYRRAEDHCAGHRARW